MPTYTMPLEKTVKQRLRKLLQPESLEVISKALGKHYKLQVDEAAVVRFVLQAIDDYYQTLEKANDMDAKLSASINVARLDEIAAALFPASSPSARQSLLREARKVRETVADPKVKANLDAYRRMGLARTPR